MAAYDPNNFAAMGPQVTARPGTKRYAAQSAARIRFFNIMAAGLEAKAHRIEADIFYILDTSAAHKAGEHE